MSIVVAIIFCVAIAVLGLGIMAWLAMRSPARLVEQEKKLEEAEKEFGHPWGGHG